MRLDSFNALSLMGIIGGRSYWQFLYPDGRTLHENQGYDWSLILKKGMVAPPLVCPGGKIGEVHRPDRKECGHQIFQFKIAEVQLGIGGGAQSHKTEAHVLGIVTAPDGTCKCFAWVYSDQQMIEFEDNIHDFKFGGPVTRSMDFDALGIRV